MRFSARVPRLGGAGAEVWGLHFEALSMQAAGQDVILLSSGDPDFEAPGRVVEALKAAVDAGRTHYGPAAGDTRLRAALAKRHSVRTGIPTDPQQITVMSGAQNGLFACAMCLFGPTDEVMVLDPTYATYSAVIGASGATPVPLAMAVRDGAFGIDLAQVEAAVTERTRGILLNNPHNPTGAVLPEPVVNEIARVCRERDLWLVSDEVYADVVFGGTFVSPCTLPGMAERTVTIGSLSKSHAMTGWRIGWTVSEHGLAGHLANLAMAMHFGCPTFVQDAATEAVACGAAEIACYRDALKLRRDLVVERLRAMPGVVPVVPNAGMFVMAAFHDLPVTTAEFAKSLLRSEGVCILPGEGFGNAARGYLRISLAPPPDRLDEACRRLGRHLEATLSRAGGAPTAAAGRSVATGPIPSGAALENPS